MEKTLSIIKPDAVKAGYSGKIITMLEENGFEIKAMKKIRLTKKQAEGFYIVHKNRPFYDSLTTFMSSGNIIVMVLEKENAIADYRNLMGATDPAKAQPGTIRALYGKNIEENAVHGSDSKESADFEIPYFFSSIEIL
ncbi:MAG: nucleoside-diphosphate kinase [Desulfurella sp.]|uniref:nucleoside-diphosphate kinase n=1 Tax=Desulfurella TaxID=33001 RepID=UPI0003E09A2E|nr:nucleoside-diphosphate kinase [Desulfurella multipotens]AHF97152.1 nucleoside diphosphate kinase [Desulfurella acetivorans A63]PMP64753.1 MAG: nucleoside-diphosphate kinase [Desulfurella multipotens]